MGMWPQYTQAMSFIDSIADMIQLVLAPAAVAALLLLLLLLLPPLLVPLQVQPSSVQWCPAAV